MEVLMSETICFVHSAGSGYTSDLGLLFFFLLNILTLKWSRYWVLPLVVKGVPMDPNSENAFPEGMFRPNLV